MVNIEDFSSYKPLSVKHVAFPTMRDGSSDRALKTFNIDARSLVQVMPSAQYSLDSARQQGPLLDLLEAPNIPDDMMAHLNKTVVTVAPTANAYLIPASSDLSDFIKQTLQYFDYYKVELGLNVILEANESIPALMFEVDLKSDGAGVNDVTAFSIAPNDTIQKINIVSGKVSLGLTKALTLIPGPIGKTISGLLNIDLNPWEFQWNMSKCQIDAAGEKNHEVYWKLYKTNTVQGFKPTLILKAKKGVTKIWASVRATWELKGWPMDLHPQVRSDDSLIPIWPA